MPHDIETLPGWIKRSYQYHWLIQLAGMPFALPHELTHTLTGRLLNVQTKRYRFHFTYPKETPLWKALLVLIAPTWLALGIILTAAWPTIPQLIGDTIAFYGLALLLLCPGDWRSMYQKVKAG